MLKRASIPDLELTKFAMTSMYLNLYLCLYLFMYISLYIYICMSILCLVVISPALRGGGAGTRASAVSSWAPGPEPAVSRRCHQGYLLLAFKGKTSICRNIHVYCMLYNIYIYIYVCIYIYMYVCVSIYIYISVCMYVYTHYVCVYIYIYVHFCMGVSKSSGPFFGVRAIRIIAYWGLYQGSRFLEIPVYVCSHPGVDRIRSLTEPYYIPYRYTNSFYNFWNYGLRGLSESPKHQNSWQLLVLPIVSMNLVEKNHGNHW